MKLLITGGTGFIGRQLCLELVKAGHHLTLTTRNRAQAEKSWELPTHFLEWDMEHGPCPEALDAYDGVIHLAGESIAGGYWTKHRKKRILHSRVKTTRALGQALAARETPLPLFLAASAIGIYPDDRSQLWDEESPHGQGFLAEVCQAWEAEVDALPQVARRVKLRFGLVLGPEGGILSKMLRPTQLGAGAVLGDGQQWQSWIHRDDIIGIIQRALEDARYEGVINAVAPEAIRQEEFQKILSSLLRRPTLLRVPAAVLRLALGELSQLLLSSQRVDPMRLRDLSYTYRFPRLIEALTDSLGLVEKKGRTFATHQLNSVQFIPRPIDQVFPFFSDPHNLERITPPMLHFEIAKINTVAMQRGTIIDYKLRLRGIPMKWKTLIQEWNEGLSFIDNQEKGPYSIWHHTHEFHPVAGGTLMTDRVRYRLPFGLLGDLAALRFVRRDVQKIFDFRRQTIAAEFGTSP